MEAINQREGKYFGAGLVDSVAVVRRVITRLFGCWHWEMSRPFTRSSETYRVCLKCGARRRFDLERWEMVGPYYSSNEIERLVRPALANQHHRKKEKTLAARKRAAGCGEPWVM